MNRFLLSSALLLLVSVPLVADPEIPASAWEKHPEGIAIAITTTTGTDKGTLKCTINAFLKNTSGTNKYFAGFDGTHREFEIFYINAQSTQLPLRDYTPPEDIQKMLECPVIKPGSTLSLIVSLTPAEVTLVKARLVKCVFNMVDPPFDVASSPKVLFPGQ